jgi:hypothetical protein
MFSRAPRGFCVGLLAYKLLIGWLATTPERHSLFSICMSIVINGFAAILIRLVFADYSGVLYYRSLFLGSMILVSHLKGRKLIV